MTSLAQARSQSVQDGAIWAPNSNSPSGTLYLAGYPFIEQRSLTVEERAELYTQATRWGLASKICFFLAITVASLLLAVGPAPAVCVGIAFGAVGVPAFLNATRFRKALDSNRVQIFGGRYTDLEDDRLQNRLRRQHLIRSIRQVRTEVDRIRYLPAIKRVWSPSARLLRGYLSRREEPVLIAPSPPRHCMGLSKDELAELGRHRLAAKIQVLVLIPAFVLWIASLATIPMAHVEIENTPNLNCNWGAVVIFLVTTALYPPNRIFRRWRTLRALSVDLRSGAVEHRGEYEEFLPRTGLLWQRKGRAARWRITRLPLFGQNPFDPTGYQPDIGEALK